MTALLFRGGQIASLVAAAAVALLAPEKPAVVMNIALSLLGQRELADGSWEGVDLLQDLSQRVQRAQLSLKLEHPAEVTLEAIDDNGSHVLYPGPGITHPLKAERTYAFPAPGSFYEIDGRARLRLTVRPLNADGTTTVLHARAGEAQMRRARLSDGARFLVEERPFRATGAGVLELAFGQ